MNTKNLFIVVTLSLFVFVGLVGFAVNRAMQPNVSVDFVDNNVPEGSDYEAYEPIDADTGRYGAPVDDVQVPPSKLKADTFVGILEEVNTGCFADGECYVTVDGKHVTVLMGWSQTTVGSVLGVEGFGDLESQIGNTVEVYAQVREDGTYTLYGSEGFYVKALDGPVMGDPLPPEVGDEPKPQVVRDGCMVGGCSSQLCGEASVISDIATTCEYREEYACYQVATCERQMTGECGWTETVELTQCLMSAQ